MQTVALTEKANFSTTEKLHSSLQSITVRQKLETNQTKQIMTLGNDKIILMFVNSSSNDSVKS